MKHRLLWVLAIMSLPVIVLSAIYPENPIWFFLGSIELVVIAVIVNTFVIVYSQRNWRANPYGRALMYSKISLMVLVNLSIVSILLGPDYQGRATLRLVVFGGILLAQGRLLQLLFATRNKDARERYLLETEISRVREREVQLEQAIKRAESSTTTKTTDVSLEETLQQEQTLGQDLTQELDDHNKKEPDADGNAYPNGA